MSKQIRLSASKIKIYKQCAYRCYMNYFLGIEQAKDSDALRIGTNWHRCLEILMMKSATICPECAKTQNNPNCVICEGTDITPDDLLDAVVRELNRAYSDVPVYKTREEWLTERARLLYSIIGYKWYYQDDAYEVLAEELYFKIPIAGTFVTGKIDKIIRTATGQVCVMEHKSSSSSLDPSSDYWGALGIDTQTTLYPWAFNKMADAGELDGVCFSGTSIPEVLYDVWRKPQTKPKFLSQAESKKFLQAAEYFGTRFEVIIAYADGDSPPMVGVTVNGEEAELKPGAKEGTFAVKETPDMYGARLLNDITEDPARFFVRKPLGRTAKDIARLENELTSILNTMKFLDETGSWYHCEDSCEAKYKCPYINYCYNNVDPTGDLLDGYRYTNWKMKELEKDGNKTTRPEQEQASSTDIPACPEPAKKGKGSSKQK